MKTIKLWTLSLGFTALLTVVTRAQEAPVVERVTVKDSVTVAVQGAQTTPLKEKLTWPNDLTVFTNATYRVGEGRERKIQEGQTLRRDGTVLNADGSTYPVYDHVAVVRGRAMITVEGEQSAVAGEYRLGNGKRVLADGTLIEPSGQRRRLLDGEILRLDGKSAEAKDTVSLIGGKVSVQKDGSKFEVAPGRTITMNEGSKVFGEGYLIKSDGTKVVLAEGQTVELAGVIRR